MSIARSAEIESVEKRNRVRTATNAAEPTIATPLTGPAALRPAALLQRQAVLGNAHTGRIFRSPAGPELSGSEEKKGCNCAEGEECSCPK
jgi:hypothetical protein